MVIAVVDDLIQDQKNIADNMERFLKEQNITPQFYFYSSGEGFINDLTPHFFDFVLLDCRMAGMDGLETARKMRLVDEEAALIFITSYEDYAVGGYEVSALGYLIKPFTYDVFSRVLKNAQIRLTRKKEIITFMEGNTCKKILVDNIVFCDIEGHYVQIHLTGGKLLRMRMTFASLKKLLTPYPQFLECYRGCLINMAHTAKADELNFLMDTGERVPFRRKEHQRLLREYSNYIFDKVRSEGL